MRSPGVAALAITVGACGGALACGAKTGLYGAAPPASDAASLDAAPGDAAPGDAVPGDAAPDTSEDASVDAPEDAAEDAPPDVHRDASRVGCTDASVAYIYVLTGGQNLYRFQPDSGVFTPIGNINCFGGSVNSMAVDRAGRAYVGFQDKRMFVVDTATAKCKATAFDFAGLGWNRYGMGFSAIDNGPAEQLFIADTEDTQLSQGFGIVDTQTFAYHFVAPFNPPLGTGAELTGTADGRLYAFFVDWLDGSGTMLAQVDKQTGTILDQTPINLGSPAAFAFAYWGGDFIFFTAPQNGGTTASRYHPADGSLVTIASFGPQIVGAGVSTCAPE